MPCERCDELELQYVSRTEAYIGLIERQSRMFRNGQAQPARELDEEILTAKAAMHEGLRVWAEHRDSHPKAAQV